MNQLLRRLWWEEQGVDMVEYALLLLFIALSAVALLDQLGTRLVAVLNMANNEITPTTTT